MDVDVVYVMIDTEEQRRPMTKSMAKQFPINPPIEVQPSLKFKILSTTIGADYTTQWLYFCEDAACWYSKYFIDDAGWHPDFDVPMAIL